jgi:hypothetical protein
MSTMNAMDDYGALFLLAHTNGLTTKTTSTAIAMTSTKMGVVNLLPVDRGNESEGARLPGSSILCGGGKARDVLPGAESLPQFSTVCGCGEEVTSQAEQAEVVRDGTIRREEALGMTGGFEPLHPPFPLTGRLVRVLRPIVQIAVLTVFHSRHDLAFGGFIALQFVRDDDPRHVRQPFQQFAEKLLGRLLVSAALHQDIKNVSILIHGAPEVVPLAIDREEDFIQMPFVTGSGPPMPEFIRIGVTELAAPLPDGFIGHENPTGEQEFFDIPVAEAEAEIQPHRVADDVRWKPVVLVGRG